MNQLKFNPLTIGEKKTIQELPVGSIGPLYIEQNIYIICKYIELSKYKRSIDL